MLKLTALALMELDETINFITEGWISIQATITTVILKLLIKCR